jgi:hypothetical protein
MKYDDVITLIIAMPVVLAGLYVRAKLIEWYKRQRRS